MKKVLFMLLLLLNAFAFAEGGDYQEDSGEVYEEPTTGASVIFNNNGKMVGTKASGEAEFIFGDRKDIRIAIQKAVLRAKANMAKFLKERLKTKEVSEEITKTAQKIKQKNGQVDSAEANRNSVDTQIEKITNSADAILRGVVVKNVKVNRKDKYVVVTVMSTFKTERWANRLRHSMESDDNTNSYNSGRNNGNNGNNGNNRNTEYRLKNESLYY